MKLVPISTKLDADLALRGYPKDPEWMFKTGLGGTITAGVGLLTVLAIMDVKQFAYLPLAIALSALSNGFLLRTIRKRIADPEARLADWNEWGDLFMAGLTWLAVQFCLFIIAAMVLSTGLLLAFASVVKNSRSLPMLITTDELALLFVFVVLCWSSFFGNYLLVNFAEEEKLGAGFAFRKVIRALRKDPKGFLTAWALACSVQALAVLGPMVTLLGVFLIPSTYFAGQIIAGTILAQFWAQVWKKEE